MIVRVKNGQKYVMAEVNNILEINGVTPDADKNVMLHGTDIKIEKGHGKLNIPQAIDAAKGEAITNAENYTDGEILKLWIDHTDDDNLQLMLGEGNDAHELGRPVPLALARSNVQDVGLYEFDNGWKGIDVTYQTGQNPPTDNGWYLVITYKQDNNDLTYTFTNIDILIDTNTEYTGANGITINDTNVISVNLDKRVPAPIQDNSGGTYELSAGTNGLRYFIRDFADLETFETTSGLSDGMYFVTDDQIVLTQTL